MPRIWIVFTPYVAASVVHVIALGAGLEAVAGPTKLILMPLLAVAVIASVLAGGTERRWTAAHTVLIAAITLSWLGDGAGAFFPGAPTLPLMLLFFGLAHLCYIALFGRILSDRRVPAWAAIYGIWWIALLVVLWPHLGGLAIAVAVYGLVLGATAVASTRCHPMIAWGGAFFLASDSVLAFRLFLPDAMPDWTSPLVMATYTLGQGLFAAGALLAIRAHTRQRTSAASPLTDEVTT